MWHYEGAANSLTWQEYMLSIKGWWELRTERQNQDCEECNTMC